jgi:hypothetical protein
MTLQDNIKQLPIEEKAAIFIELQDDEELAAYLSIKKNEQWLREQLSTREEKILNGDARFTNRDHLNKQLAAKYEI